MHHTNRINSLRDIKTHIAFFSMCGMIVVSILLPQVVSGDTGATIRISVDSAGGQANGGSLGAPALTLTADGRFVAFLSFADNLVVDDTNTKPDIFVHDRQTGEIVRANVDSEGKQANDFNNFSPAISENGRYVTFVSDANNLVINDTNAVADVFIHDLKRQVSLTWEFTTIAEGAWNWLSEPANDRGDVGFICRVAQCVVPDLGTVVNEGIYISTLSGNLDTVAQEGTPIPDSDDEFIDFGTEDSDLRLTLDDSDVSFLGTISSGLSGIYARVDGAIKVVADTSTIMPDTDSDDIFSDFGFAPSISSGSVALFGHSMSGQVGTYQFLGGPPSVVANTESTIPTTQPVPDAGTFTGFGVAPSLDGDDVAFLGFGPALGSIPLQQGIYLSTAGGIKVLADLLAQFPGDEANFSRLQHSPSLHRGNAAFFGKSESDRSGIIKSTSSGLEVVADTETNLPNEQRTFSSFDPFPSIDHDNVAFVGKPLSFIEEAVYVQIGRKLVKVFDGSDLSNGEQLAVDELRVFHEALSGNSVAFRAQMIGGNGFPERIIRADLTTVVFGDFADSTTIMFNGDMGATDTTLRLTQDEPSQAGSAFFAMPFNLDPDSSFRTEFQFVIGGTNNGGSQGSDGLAFVVHNDLRGAMALGNGGEGLGFGINDTTATPVAAIAPSLVIEFDTHLNAFPERIGQDLDDNHVALIIDGDVSDHRASARPALLLNSGSPLFAWVDYDGVKDRLWVYLSDTEEKPSTPLFSFTVDLYESLGNQVFFGFAAGTGDGFNIHEVQSWEINARPFFPEGDLNGDEVVDGEDRQILRAALGTSEGDPGFNPDADYDGDGSITYNDYRIWYGLFRSS